MSPHAYALVDPVFQAMVQLGQQETRGELDQFCVRCHSPFAVATRQVPVSEHAGSFTQRFDVGPIAAAGVSCDVCHSAVTTRIGRGAPDLELDGTRRGGIADPVANDFHPSAHGALQKSSALCGSCHDVIADLSSGPLRVEATYTEWLAVPSSGTCQECHMPATRGKAAVDGPERVVHDHRFVGPDVSLLPPAAFPGHDEMRAATRELLSTRTLRLSASQAARGSSLEVKLQNLAGHALPSGATADRQLWLEVRVFAADSGREVFSSGTLDANGDLRVDDAAHTLEPGSDPQLQLFRQRLLHGEGAAAREVHFVWQASGFEERLIGALEHLTVRYDLSGLPAGVYRASVRARLRALPPYLLRKLEQEAALDPAIKERVPIVDLARTELSLTREP
jgi:hypothetical protein